ncbi:hypothetical protein BC835DRAFT_1372633 [Cytidiella melzeri]|nr:hypothetical protein BC835DRAFT_1372633 [Cytidiella melzeri]
MIIPEDTPQSPKGQSQRPHDPSVAPPPAYSGPQQSYQAGTSSTLPLYHVVPPSDPVLHTEPAGKRFFKAFVVAVLIWALFAALTGSMAEAGRYAGRPWQEHKDAATAWPSHRDGKVLLCMKGPWVWQQERDAYSVTLELNRTADALYMFTRGISTSGNVIIVQDQRRNELDTVHVDIVAKHMTPSWLHIFAVCALERREGEQGIGIFTPTRWTTNGRLPRFEFEVTIRLPRLSGDNHPLPIKSLETALPNFTHDIADLLGSVNFEKLSLHASDARIFSRSVNATQGLFKTSNAPIKGHYESHGNLTLQTSNEDVAVTVSMFNHDREVATVTQLETSNGQIKSAVNLFSASDSGKGGSFIVGGTTSNAGLALDVPILSADSQLALSAKTSNALAQVRVPDTYEGVFDLKTSNELANVHCERGDDPTGRGRGSVFWESGTERHRKGGVHWKDKAYHSIPTFAADGSIFLRTSNALAALYI